MNTMALPRVCLAAGSVQAKAFAIGAAIQHDFYHDGEINHLRALRRRDDAWPPGLKGE